jgi:hypothetical protein
MQCRLRKGSYKLRRFAPTPCVDLGSPFIRLQFSPSKYRGVSMVFFSAGLAYMCEKCRHR